MRCVECGEREGTVVQVEGTGHYRDVRYRGDPEEDLAAPPPPPPPAGADRGASSPHGRMLCVECARRRYEARRPPGAPSSDEFMREPS